MNVRADGHVAFPPDHGDACWWNGVMTITKAELFHQLHNGDRVLVLANAWDVASARVVEDAGAAAVATTSAGVAWSLGAPDGDRLGRDLALELIARITTAVGVPVTADVESGFGADPDDVAETIRGVVAAGAVGVNLEDGLHGGVRPVTEQVERLAAAREAAQTGLYINARIDTYLRAVGDPASRLQDTLDRAAAYLRAGADGIFVPGVTDLDTVASLVRGVGAPLNVLAGPGSPAVAEFGAVGVARVSLGSSIAEAAYDLVRRSAREALTSGTYESVPCNCDYDELNALMR
jgi:2-methylisocitrate lyase-like PEP mutase family enzyme